MTKHEQAARRQRRNFLKAAGGAAKLEEMSLDEVERYLIQRTLSRHEGNVSQAAKALGLSRSAMYRRLQKHGLE